MKVVTVLCCLGVGILFAAPSVKAMPMVSVVSTQAVPGSVAQVAVSYTTDTETPALQFDLLYATNYMLSGTPVGGNALSDHQVASAEVTPGVRRVLIFSFSNAPLTNGVLAYVPFTIVSNSPDHDEMLTLSNVVVSSPAGTTVSAGSSNGVLSIVIPPTITSVTPTNGGTAHLLMAVTAGRSYVVQAATNLVSSQWVSVVTNVSAGATLGVDDLLPGNVPNRFYRAYVAP